MKAQVSGMLKGYFRPEFLNRIDEIIVFHALDKEQIKAIAEILLKNLALRFRENIGANLRWDDEALEHMAQKGYDPSYGARPLKRLVQHEIETMLSKYIIKGEIEPGATVTLSAEADQFIVKMERKANEPE
jgi:ATP-dependent Clp protease ATP-binding subunit ClpB